MTEYHDARGTFAGHPEIDDTNVDDEDHDEYAVAPNGYNISSYGWDPDVEGLVKRLERGDIFVPGFQREFVWESRDKSRFIESLILGLPVPNIFLAQEPNNKYLYIVDGQQRLRSLQEYLGGKFFLSGNEIQEEFRGCYFSPEVAKAKSSKVLQYKDMRTLADAALHCIVIKPDPVFDDPESGAEYNSAVIQIFRRINTGGRPLQSQEIRTSIFHGELDNLLRELNNYGAWRNLFGEPHSRLKDMELILRFIALRENHDEYRSPMPKFLDGFMEANRNPGEEKITEIGKAFKAVIDLLEEAFGKDILRSGTRLSVSRFDALTIGFDAYLSKNSPPSIKMLEKLTEELEEDEDYKWSTSDFVNNTERVRKRIDVAKNIFGA